MNSNVASLNHRSKKRIQELGEVFTPEEYVKKMLDLLGSEDSVIWEDVQTTFFEPTCGHGNFVEEILKRRIKALHRKAKKQRLINAHLYAIASSFNTIWAIDLDDKNISICRERVFDLALEFIKHHEASENNYDVIKKHKEFFAHLICSINWQIHENELMSSIVDDPKEASQFASKTTAGKRWFDNNQHRPIDFELPWSEYYEVLTTSNVIPNEFSRALKFLSDLSSTRFKEFEYVSNVLKNCRTKLFQEKLAG